MDPSDDPSLHRLEGSGSQTGGLVIKKKSSDSTFKIPKPSLLGLDRLAAEKRKEREESKRLISFKETEYDDVSATPASASSETVRTPDLTSVHKLSRQFREPRDDTPSHTGGVSEKARDRLVEHSEKDKRGVYVSTKDRKRSSDEDDYKSKYDDRHRRDKYRDRERDRDRDRRNRDRYKERSDRDRYNRSNRSDRNRRSDSERSLHTPRFKDEPKTPKLGKMSGSSNSWDDDDDEKVPTKRSAWDFPTPNEGDFKRPDWSTRSSSSSIYRNKGKSKYEDDTPRPTPAHKYNSWANDRKRSGATPQTGS